MCAAGVRYRAIRRAACGVAERCQQAREGMCKQAREGCYTTYSCINYARWATTTISYSSHTGSGHKLCDWKVGQGGGTPIGGRAGYTGAAVKTWSPAKQGD